MATADRTVGPGIREVDQAVRAVLAQWFGSGSTQTVEESGAADASVEVFAGRLLSLRHAEALPTRLQAVHVAPGTVVTPLARDHLKRRGVAIRFAARAEVDRLRNTGEWGFAVTIESGLMAAVRRTLLDAPEGWLEVGNTLEAAAAWVAEGAGRGVVVITDEAAVSVYRACLVQGVRAAAVCDAESADRAVRGLGANLLAIEPAGKSIPLVRQVAVTFRRGGGPVPPAWLS